MTTPELYKSCNGKSNGTRQLGSNSKRVANARQLSRIIFYLRDIGIGRTITQIHEDTGLSNSLCDALNWLCSNKIIIKSNTSSYERKVYKINPEWCKLKK